MEDINATPLGKFRKKAKLVTYIALGLGLVFACCAAGFNTRAESSYSSYLTYSTSRSYSSLTGNSYLEEYQEAKSNADLCTLAFVFAGGVADIAILAWVGANLHIASKKTSVAALEAETTAVPATAPMQPEAKDGAPVPPVANEPVAKEPEPGPDASAPKDADSD